MKNFKLRKGSLSEIYPITEEAFERTTKKLKPYVQEKADGSLKYFAVCPACDNPIQLLGIFKATPKITPHGRHYTKNVSDLADYNYQAYEYCPYASHQYHPLSKDDLKTDVTEYEITIYNTARSHFDQIIYILQKETGFYINTNFAAKLLEDYIAARGWLYKGATINNIPWMLLYACRGFDPRGRWVRKGSALYKKINKEHILPLEDTDSEYYAKIGFDGWKRKYNYMWYGHKRTINDETLNETINIELAVQAARKWETLYSETIRIKEEYFLNLINSNEARKYRKPDLLEIAKQLMPDLQ